MFEIHRLVHFDFAPMSARSYAPDSGVTRGRPRTYRAARRFPIARVARSRSAVKRARPPQLTRGTTVAKTVPIEHKYYSADDIGIAGESTSRIPAGTFELRARSVPIQANVNGFFMYASDTGAAASSCCINQINQGTAVFNRIGRTVHITGMMINYRVYPSTDVAMETASHTKLALVRARTSSINVGPQAVWTQYPGVTGGLDPNALRQLIGDSKNYQVLREWTHCLENPARVAERGSSTDSTFIHSEMIDLRRYKIMTRWQQGQASGLLPNIVNDGLFLFALHDGGYNNNDECRWTIGYRLYYEDC